MSYGKIEGIKFLFGSLLIGVNIQMSNSDSIQPSFWLRYWPVILLIIVLLLIGAYLFNQHQQREADLKLAELALEKSKTQDVTGQEEVQHDTDQVALSTSTQNTADLKAQTNGESIQVESEKSKVKLELSKLSGQIDNNYHDQMLTTDLSNYGLQAISTAPASLKSLVKQLDRTLQLHLMSVWGRASSDQVAKQLEGWSEDGNSISYYTAWDSDRSQCTWYVVQWNKNNHSVTKEGYLPCF